LASRSLKRKKFWYGSGRTPGIFGLNIRKQMGVGGPRVWGPKVDFGNRLGLMEVGGPRVEGFGVRQSRRKKV
jgi:hypothetical protein